MCCNIVFLGLTSSVLNLGLLVIAIALWELEGAPCVNKPGGPGSSFRESKTCFPNLKFAVEPTKNNPLIPYCE